MEAKVKFMQSLDEQWDKRLRRIAKKRGITMQELNANLSTTLDWSNLSCSDGQSANVQVTVNWGDGSQTSSNGANLPGYILSPSPVHTYSVWVPAEYTGSIYCLEDGATGHISLTFTVMIYNGYTGGGLGGGSRPRPM